MSRARIRWIKRVAVIAAVAAVSAAAMTPGASGVRAVRGFDGTTITVAGIGLATNFGGADIGTQARFKRANDTNELKGIKLKYLEFADDKGDPTTATSEARRLVTQENIFAIVPDFSPVNPGPYLNQQHVPYVGFAFDSTYCTAKPSTSIYGFGWNGCLVPASPPVMPDSYELLYKHVSEKTGKKHPTIALFSNDNQSGRNSTKFGATGAQGAGFKVVYAKGTVPMTTSDFTPYVQTWLSADGGKAPDDIHCLLAVQCIPVWNAVKNAGYTGTFSTTLYGDFFTKTLGGTVASALYNPDPSPGMTQMQKDLEAFKPGTKVSSFSNAPAYFAADMFIQALKKVGKNITPEAVQKALATQTWQIKGLAGPTKYPASTVVSSPSCNALVQSDGTQWTTVEKFACSSKTFKIDPKFQG